MRRLAFACSLLGGAAMLASGQAMAQAADTPPQTNLLGDAGGVRSALAAHGVTVLLTDAEEVFGNASGGMRRGATYDAASTLTVQVDSAKAFGWDGGQVNVSALQLRGRSLSQYYLGDLQTVSGISATPTTRLWEAWYQQQIVAGQVDVRVGLQSLDQEFMVSQGAAVFLNTAMGWPMLPTADLYAGGPAYPLASLGARVKAQLGGFTLLAGAYQDNPPGGPFAVAPPINVAGGRGGRAGAGRCALGRQFQFAHRGVAGAGGAIRRQPARADRHGYGERAAWAAGELQAGHVVRQRALPRCAL